MAGTCTYVIGVIHDHDDYFLEAIEPANDTWHYPSATFAWTLDRAKHYDDILDARDDVERLKDCFVTCKIIEVQKCPKCDREFTEHPAISREDNETEICPRCGVAEAVEAFAQSRVRQHFGKEQNDN